MKIDPPTTVGYGIGPGGWIENIFFRQDMTAEKAAALALARNRCDPIQRVVGSAGMVAGVFDIIPNAESNTE
jgi:hypothetical protein